MFSATVVGLVQLNTKLDDLAPAVQDRVRLFFGIFLARLRAQVKDNIAVIFDRGPRDSRGRFKARGALYNSIQMATIEEGGEIIGRVYSQGVPYALIQEEGGHTGPHTIVPRVASVLAFSGPAGLVFAKRVNHPGSLLPARPYASLALAQMRGEFEGGMRAAVWAP